MLVSVGLDQKTGAPSSGPAAPPVDGLEAALAGYAALDGIDEVAVLSVGHAAEVFAWASCPAAAAAALRHALGARVGGERALLERHGAEALRHLARIVSNVDASVAGEPEIVAQAKGAFGRATRAGAAGRELGAILERALHIATRVRSETAIGATRGHAAGELAEKVIGLLAGRRFAVLGAGELPALAARHLRLRGAGPVVVMDDALLAAELAAEARPIEALPEELLRVDVVLCGVAPAPEALLPTAMARIAAARRRPILVVDLAVPAAVPVETGRVRDVYLCDVGDLDRVLRAAVDDRAAAIAHAERVIDEEIARWVRGQAERRRPRPVADLEACDAA